MDTIVSFTDFYFAWKKGNIENTNKIIRQYIPKNTEFNKRNDEDLREIQLRIIHNQVKNLISIHHLLRFFKIFSKLHIDVEFTEKINLQQMQYLFTFAMIGVLIENRFKKGK